MVFGEILFEVNTFEYEEWVEQTKSRFASMVKTMHNVARLIELFTVPYVPLDTSALEQSFDYVVSSGTNFVMVRMGYDAVDENSGFHYAEYQHNHLLNHPKRGQAYYLYHGIQASKSMAYSIIETDYMSLFGRVRGVY